MANKRSLGKKRCKKGSTRCVTTGECHVKKTGDKTKCKNGMRKCADGKCYAHSRKKGRPVKDKKPKVKRTSGYILFSNATKDKVKTKLAIGEEKPKNTEVMKELAIMWKALTVEARYNWNNKAEREREAAAGR